MSWPAFTPKQIAAYVEQKRSIFYPKADEPPRGPHELIEVDCRGEKVLRRYSGRPGVDVGTWVESMVAQRAARAGVRIANVSTFDSHDQVGQDEKGTYQTLWPVDGVMLADVTDRKTRLMVYADLGRQLARLHSIEATGAGFVYPSEERLAGVYQRWCDHIGGYLAERHVTHAYDRSLLGPFNLALSSLRALDYWLTYNVIECRTTLLHGDLSDRNVMVNPAHDRFAPPPLNESSINAILDWEDALIGDPVYDLANWATFHDAEEADWPVLFDAYYLAQGRCRYRPWDFDLRFWTYYLRISLSKLVVLHKAGHKDLTRGRARIDRALKALNA